MKRLVFLVLIDYDATWNILNRKTFPANFSVSYKRKHGLKHHLNLETVVSKLFQRGIHVVRLWGGRYNQSSHDNYCIDFFVYCNFV